MYVSMECPLGKRRAANRFDTSDPRQPRLDSHRCAARDESDVDHMNGKLLGACFPIFEMLELP